MDNTPDWDSLSDTPPAVAPVGQDRSTPVDAQVADFADEANRRVAAGEDPATVEADLQSQVQSAQPKIPKGKTTKASEWDSLLDAPPELPGPPEEVGPPAALAGSPAPDTTATGDVPPDFGTGGGPLDTSGFAPAMAAQGRAIASGIPRALAGGEASLVKFAANIAPAVVAGTGNIAGGQALEQTLSPYAEEAGQVEQQVAQERADDRASGASTPISRAIESGVGAAYALPQYAVVPEFEGADLAVAAVKALPASYSAAKTTFADLLPKVGVAKALEASGLTGIVNLVGASLPLGAAGTAAERVAAGAGVGVASEEAGRAGQNVILSDHPELQQPLDPEAIVQAGLTGGALGGFAGHPRLSDADIAAARVQQLTRGLTNAREIPQDQGGVPSQGTVEEGGREGGGEDIQQNASTGDTSGNAEGLTDVDQNVQPTDAARAVAVQEGGEEGKGQAAPEVLADQGTADATASVAPDAQVPGDADTARAADAVAAGEEGLPAATSAESLITDQPDDDWLRANPRKNPELFGINRPKYPSLLEWVARGGGLNREAFRAEYGVDPAYWNTREAQRANQKIVGKPLFRKDGGMTPEDLREAMQQDGWLPPEAPDAPAQLDNHDAFELFNRALGGKDVVHPADDNFEAMVRHVEEGQRQELEDRAVAQRLGYTSADEMRAAHEADNRVAATQYSRQQDLFGPPKELYEKAKAKRAENLDLFGGATSKDAVDAAQRAKDLELRGGERAAVPMRAGEGELFAGPRPEQETIPEPPAKPNLYSMAAYHGSPHDFDEFSSEHIGTGEGAQAYGHGLYFAGKKDIADHYKTTLAESRYGKESVSALSDFEAAHPQEAKDFSEEMLAYAGRRLSRPELATELQNVIFRDRTGVPQRISDDLAAHIVANAKKAPSPAGHGYEVELAPEDHEYLDWDKPLSEQSPHVQEAIKPLVEQIRKLPDKNGPSNRGRDAVVSGEGTGSDFYRRLGFLRSKPSAFPEIRVPDDVAASKALHDAGVRGIRYLDATSRDTTTVRPVTVDGKTQYEVNPGWNAKKFGMEVNQKKYFDTQQEAEKFVDQQRSRNYVIFNDKDVKILNKYAQREGAPQTDNLTRDQAREALTREFGATAMRKLEANGLTLTPRADLAQHAPELTPQQRAGVKGFTPPDKSSANVIHDNVTRAELPETVIHEVVHANLDRILPEATRNALASAIQARASKSPEVKASLDAIPKTTPKANYREEVLAQTMGDLYTQPIGRKVLDAFKLGLNRMGVPLDWINAHEAAIRQIGIENLRHYAEAPRRNPVTTVQMAPRAAPAGAGQAPAEKPRIRVPVDQVPVQRVPERPEAVSRPETPTASDTAIGTKNAAKATERAERGLGPVVSELRPKEKEVWNAALQRREADPTVGYRLSAELAKNPRTVSSEDEALLMQHGAELHNRYDDVLQRIETAQKAGNTADAVNAQMERMAIEQDLATNDKATKEIGTEWSATGRMRQKLAERDFSMARQVLRFKAITGVDDLPQALRDQIAQHVKTIQAREAELSAALADNAKLREQQTPPVARRRIAPADRRTLDDEFSALAQRAAQLRKTAAGGTRYARVEDPELASVIRRMARNRSDAGETDPDKVLAAIHEAIGGGVPKQDIADTITSNAPYRKQTQNELQQRYNDLKRALRDPAVQRDATRAKQLQSQLSDIKSRIQRKDFSPPDKREKPVYGEAVQHLQLQIAKAKNELNALATRQERLNDTPLGKTLRTIVDAKIFNILASVSVYKKLAGAVVTRNASQIGEEALGTVLAKLPGLRKYAAYSPRYGGRGFWAGMGEFGKGLKDAFARAKEDLQQNQNKWDILYGHKRVSQEFTDFSGRMGDAIRTPGGLNKAMETAHAGARFIGGTHAAMKEFVSEPEMRVAQMQIGRYTREQLLKKGMTPEAIEEYMGRESTMASVQAQAYEHALESKFQGKNTLTQAINSTLARWEKTGGIPGKIAAFLAKEEYPVRGIPVNIAKELLTSYPFGAFKAMAKAMRFDTLKEEGKPAAADYIMKNLRKQGIGIATLALGGYLQSQLGGVPHAEKKDKSAPVKPGEAMVAGQNVGTQIMHGPVPELMEMGASLARVYRREYGSRGFTAFLESLAQVYPTLALQSIPYTDQPMRQARTVENAQKYDHRAGYDKLLGEMIRSNVVPAAVQQAARAYDPYQGFRNARNIPEDVKLGVPGLREQVPHSR